MDKDRILSGKHAPSCSDGHDVTKQRSEAAGRVSYAPKQAILVLLRLAYNFYSEGLLKLCSSFCSNGAEGTTNPQLPTLQAQKRKP